MAKIYYVVENHDDYCQVNFFKSEKEAQEYGTSEFPDFQMGEEATEDEENGGWYTGAELTFKKGFLFLMEEGDWYIQDMDDEEARAEVEGKENFGAIYFDGFKPGAYGYLGNGADGKNYSWSADDDGIQEALKQTKYNMKHIKLFEQFSKTLNEGLSSSDQKKLEAFADQVSEEIIDANQNNRDFDEDQYTPDAMIEYFMDQIEMNDYSVKEFINDWNWREMTMELGL